MAYYNKLRDNLRKEDDLPSDMSWEEMSDGIFQKMGRKEKKRRVIFWWFVPMLIVSGFVGYYLMTSTNEPNIEIPKDIKENMVKEDNGQNIIASEKALISDRQKDDDAVILTKVVNINAKANQLINQKESSNEGSKGAKIAAQNEHNADSNSSESVTLINSDLSNQVPENTKIIDQLINVSNITNAKDMIKVELITSIIRPNIRSNSETLLPVLEVKSIIPLQKDSKTYLGSMDISLTSGVIFWKIGSSANLKLNTEQHKATISEKELPGYHIALHNEVRMSKYFFLKTSLDYQKWYSEFYYSGTKINSMEVDNVIVKVEENLLSGEKSLIRGKASIYETVDRTLRHRNEQNSVLLSLSPGYQWEHNKWSFKTSAGLFFTLSKFGNGKTLWNDEIVAYDGVIPQYNDKMQIGYLSSLNVKYAISNRYYVQSMIGYHKFISNINAENTISKPSIFNISLGIGVQF